MSPRKAARPKFQVWEPPMKIYATVTTRKGKWPCFGHGFTSDEADNEALLDVDGRTLQARYVYTREVAPRPRTKGRTR